MESVTVIWLCLAMWWVFGMFAYAGGFAHCQYGYHWRADQDYWHDMGWNLLLGLVLGPIFLLIVWHETDFEYGFKWF